MCASYDSIDAWLRQAEAAGTTTVLTVDLAWVLGMAKSTLAGLARRGEFGPFEREAGRFCRVSLGGVRAFVERYKCAFVGWLPSGEACRRSGAKASTLIFWLDSGVIVGGRDMHGRVRIDPASLAAVREQLRWTRLPGQLTLQGVTHYSLAHLARGLTVNSGTEPNDEAFAREFRRNYSMFYRWMTQTPLSRHVKRLGRRRALYIPSDLYERLVNVVRPGDAAAIAGETSYMLHYWARKGRLGFVRFDGTQKMIPREELSAFLQSRRATRKRRTVPPVASVASAVGPTLGPALAPAGTA